MVPEALRFVFGVAVACAAALAVGVYAFLPRGRVRTVLVDLIRTDWRYLGVAWGVTFLVDRLARYHLPVSFTAQVYAVEGHAVSLFQPVVSRPLTLFFGAVYLVGFPFLVLFTYLKLKSQAEEEAYRYALGYVCLVALATPFFLFAPVRVAGDTLADVHPLLYQLSPVIRSGVLATDTLVKSFPSLHTGLATLAALYARKTDATYARVAEFLAVATVLSTLYLGIHWLSDAIGAIVLVLVAYWVSQRIDDPRRPFGLSL